MMRLSVVKETVAHDSPTPNPQHKKFLFPDVALSFSSVTIVNGMEAEEVLPKWYMQDGTFSAGSFNFFAIMLFIAMFA